MSWTKKATEQYKSDLHDYRNNHGLQRRLEETVAKIMEHPTRSGKMMSGEAHPSKTYV